MTPTDSVPTSFLCYKPRHRSPNSKKKTNAVYIALKTGRATYAQKRLLAKYTTNFCLPIRLIRPKKLRGNHILLLSLLVLLVLPGSTQAPVMSSGSLLLATTTPMSTPTKR